MLQLHGSGICPWLWKRTRSGCRRYIYKLTGANVTRYSTICSSEKQKEKLLPGVHFRRLATGTIARERCQWKTPRPILKWEQCARETLHPFLLQCDWVIYYLPEWSF